MQKTPINIIKGVVGRLRNLSEIGSLARPEEDLKELIHREKERLLSAWDKEKAPKQVPLFRQIMTPEQQELPFDKVTDDQFWGGVLSQVTKALDEYYKDASERGDTRAQVFAHEASRGFKFLELCNKRYDVVATNPPYMGSKNMGKELKGYVQRVYPEGKRDLYAAFILRNWGWTNECGIVAMVTMHSWMFLHSFSEMRNMLIKNSEIMTISHLGPRAFDPDNKLHEGVGVVLFSFRNLIPKNKHHISALRLVAPRTPDEKERLLRNIAKASGETTPIRIEQFIFIDIPESPLIYWLRPIFFSLLSGQQRLSSVAKLRQGIVTGDNDRFLRYYWEISDVSKGWIPFAKGGGYKKWWGFTYWQINWDRSKKYIAKNPIGRTRDESFFGKFGWAYSLMSCGSLSPRALLKEWKYDNGVIVIFPDIKKINRVGAFLASRLCSFLLRLLSQSVRFNGCYIELLPWRENQTSQILDVLPAFCLSIKQNTSSLSLNETTFSLADNNRITKGNLLEFYRKDAEYFEFNCSLIHTSESIIDDEIFRVHGVKNEDLKTVIDELGIPTGWYPLIIGNDAIPEMAVDSPYPTIDTPKEMIEHLQKHKKIKLTGEELQKLKTRLSVLYEAGRGVEVEDVTVNEEETNHDEEKEVESFIGKKISIPTETFLEELSFKMEIHPISIYWLLKEMREEEGLICWSECKRFAEEYFTVMILRMLGFRWPKQIEANEAIPDWADKNGIIPITEHTEEKTLLERIRDRIGADFGENRIADIEAEFRDILYNAASKEMEIKGKSSPKKKMTLAQWLEKEFFKRHTSQFKKRPVAWHLTSSNGTFQVLLFYHKISQDMFKNLKNRHLARVQSYYGSLLERARRGESVAGGLTSGKLQDVESELEEFSNKLDKLIMMPYEPLIDDGVRINIAPLQKLGLLASPVLAGKDVDRAIADRNRWREDDKEQVTVWRI